MDGGASVELQPDHKPFGEGEMPPGGETSAPGPSRNVSFSADVGQAEGPEDDVLLPASVEGLAGALHATSLGLRDDDPVDRA